MPSLWQKSRLHYRQFASITKQKPRQLEGPPVTREICPRIRYGTEQPTNTYTISPIRNSYLISTKKGYCCADTMYCRLIIKISLEVKTKTLLCQSAQCHDDVLWA